MEISIRGGIIALRSSSYAAFGCMGMEAKNILKTWRVKNEEME